MSQVHVLFHSTHHALWANEVLQEAGLESKVVSVPRELSSDCGYCVLTQDADRVAAALDAAGVEYDRVVSDPV